MKKEILIGLRRPAFCLTLLLFFLLGLYCTYLTQNNLEYLFELGDLTVLEESVFPPAADAILLFSCLIGGTLFTMRGYIDVYADRRTGVFRQRFLLLGEKRYAAGRILAILAELCIHFLIILAMGSLAQSFIDRSVPMQTWQSRPLSALLFQLAGKFLAGVLVLSVSYLLGSMAGLLISQPVAGILLCLALDQLLLASSPLYTLWLYDAFRSASFMFSVPEGLPLPWTSPFFTIALGLSVFFLFAGLMAFLIRQPRALQTT